MVYEPSADYEEQVVEAVVDFLETKIGAALSDREWLDRKVRDTQAVELVASNAERSFVIEHTRLNSFDGQIGDDAQLLEKLWPILPMLDGSVPGRFELAIRAGDISKLPKRREPAALAEIVEWVRTEAQQLDAEFNADRDYVEGGNVSITATLPRVGFELRLTRQTTHGSEVYLARLLPADFEQQRQRDVARALAAKNPKLAKCSEGWRTRVLILETRDFQLQSAALVAHALEAAANERDDMPELVYLVETNFGAWNLYALKDHADYVMRHGKAAGPFRIGIKLPSEPEP